VAPVALLAGPALLAGLAASGAALAAGPAALAAGGGPHLAAPTRPAKQPRPGLVAPVLSPQRAPLLLQASWAGYNLAQALSAALSPAALGARAAAASCAEVAQGGRALFADHPGLPVLPASNMKLVTATALLDQLGPAYRFTTSVVAARPPVAGVVDGDIWFVGGGDPLLREPSFAAGVPGGDKVWTDLDDLVPALRAAGLKAVAGSVLGDASRYDSVPYVASWPYRYIAEGDVGPLSALGIDDGFATAGPPVPLGAPPPVQSAGVLTGLLRKAGIKVAGPPGEGKAPAHAYVLARLVSPPLVAILGEVLRESDNTAMELLTKELGLKVEGVGSTAAGTAAVRADLAQDRLPLKGFSNVDGSGLSREDRVTCALLLAVLERSGPNGALTKDLPVAARSGTLAGQFEHTVAAGRLEAKTGTLDGVKALSGWVRPGPGASRLGPLAEAPVAFSVVLNDLPPSDADPDALVDRAGLAVARYPLAPALADFEPGG
jgi:D-alanyl-D-alanine carboxypeptidase/D-alanyl-D-alanine-endopeptidase (penicillin-binding protein 4)